MIEGAGLRASARPEGGWYIAGNNAAMYSQEGGFVSVQQQPYSSSFQINTPFTPSKVQQIQSFIGSVPTWNHSFRENSGQAQTPQIINAPVTSPYPLGPYQPFVADPIHHHTPNFDGRPSRLPVVPNYLQAPPSRDRILAWAHGVYSDLVQSTQVHQVSQATLAGTQLPSRPLVRPLAQPDNSTTATYQHNLCNQQVSLSEIASNSASPVPQLGDPTDDNFDRRKKRKIDNVSEAQTSSSHTRRPRRNTASGYSQYGYTGSSGSVTPADNSSFQDYSAVRPGFDAGPYPQVYEQPYSQHHGSISVTPEVNIPTTLPNVMVPAGIGTNISSQVLGNTGRIVNPPAANLAAHHALDTLQQLCAESGWRWLDGMLLGGCIAYVWDS